MILKALLKPPHLRASDDVTERHATWLELFYDLVIVVAVSQTSSLLLSEHSLPDLLRIMGMFVPVWWVWAGHTIYATRYDSDDLVYRCLTFIQMFAVMGMAVEVTNAVHGDGFRYGAAYLAARVVLLMLLSRAYYHAHDGRSMNRVYLAGFGIGTTVWACSLAFDEKWRLILWAVSICFELSVPWYIWFNRQTGSSVSSTHILERFGLFTIIVLGESLVAEVRGLSGTQWQPLIVSTAAAGFILTAAIWWVYFAHLERAVGRIKLGSGQPFIYAHLPLQIGIVLLSAGTVQTLKGNTTSNDAQILLVTGFALWALGWFFLHLVMCSAEARTVTPRYVAISIVSALLVTCINILPPATMLWLLAGVMFIYVIIDERDRLASNSLKCG